MKRLTEKGYEYQSYDFADEGIHVDMNRLREYEDTDLSPERCAELAKAESENRLVELPCKVGDAVYEVVNDGFMFPSGRRVGKIIERKFRLSMCDKSIPLYYKEIGKEIFLTREEAEKALEKEA